MQSNYFKVYGRVQGVFFRKFTKKIAEENSVCGWIQNDPSGKFVKGEFYAE